jgi:octaprenyl-diphosphate synthase
MSEVTYERILRDKTASLFRFATSAGARLGGASHEQARPLSDFGEALGIAFQLVDDALDYTGEETGKTLFADLREGKITLPLVLAVEKVPALGALLQQIHDGDDSIVDEVRRAVMASGVCAEVRRRAREFTHRALKSLSPLPATRARALLESVALELADRAF